VRASKLQSYPLTLEVALYCN